MSVTLITTLEAITVAVLVLVGQIVAAYMAKRSAAASTHVDQQARATEAWRTYAEKMEGRLERVERRLTEAEVRETDNRRRITALERQAEQDRDLIRRLLGRLRKALDEIRALGGTVSDVDVEVTDLAAARLSMKEDPE